MVKLSLSTILRSPASKIVLQLRSSRYAPAVSRCLSPRKYFLTTQKFDELAIFKASAIKRRTSIQSCITELFDKTDHERIRNMVFRTTSVSYILMDMMTTVLEIYISLHTLFTLYLRSIIVTVILRYRNISYY